MVVLSACETGIGEFKTGEGVVGLGRAFALAGAKSLVTSLWAVNDKATSDLVTSFFENIYDGLPKDIALQKAKLEYLENSKQSHPFYWAAFVPMGDVAAIDMAKNYFWWTSIMVFSLFIFFVFWRIKSHN